MEKVTTFVVHYTKLVERKEKILRQFDSNLFDLNFIEDFDAEVLNDETIKKFYDTSSVGFNNKVNIWNHNKAKYYIMNKAELSCTIKHIQALKHVSDSRNTYSFIIEDDAIPKNNKKFINQFFNLESLEDWDAVFFGAGIGKNFIMKKTNVKNYFKNRFVKIEHPATNCLEAYVIKKDAASKILSSIVPFNLVSDWEIAYQFYKHNMNVYWFLPHLFVQGSKNGEYKSTLR